MNIDKMIKSAYDLSIPISSYINQISENTFLNTEKLLVEIEKIIQSKNEIALENILLIASKDGINRRYTDILCTLLKQDWHESHEDIVMMLEKIKDPSSIKILYSTAINIPDFDDGRALARKCIWALGAINNEEAKAKLIELKNMNEPIISEIAAMELKDKF